MPYFDLSVLPEKHQKPVKCALLYILECNTPIEHVDFMFSNDLETHMKIADLITKANDCTTKSKTIRWHAARRRCIQELLPQCEHIPSMDRLDLRCLEKIKGLSSVSLDNITYSLPETDPRTSAIEICEKMMTNLEAQQLSIPESHKSVKTKTDVLSMLKTCSDSSYTNFWPKADSEGKSLLTRFIENDVLCGTLLLLSDTQFNINEPAQSDTLSLLMKKAELFTTALRIYPALAKQISSEALCRPRTTGPDAGTSPLYWLCANSNGRNILKGTPQLLERITSEALCRPRTTDPDAGISPLYWLCGNPDGRDILKSNPKLLEGVTSEAFCRPRTTGPDAGTSPLYWLCATSNGRNILKSNPKLLEGITSEALCRPCTTGPDAGTSPLYWLCANPRDILKGTSQLLEGITSEALCRPRTTGPDAGISPLYWLCGNPDGCDILKGNPKLLEGVTSEALCRPCTTGPDASSSPLFWLCCNPEGRDILKSNPKLLEGITSEALCRPCTTGPNAGISPLYWLCVNPDGRDILKGTPQLLEGITSEALCRPRTTGPDAGTSPLYWLCGNPEGRDILKGNPKLLEGVTSEALCRPRTTGPDAGTSPLYWLCASSEGRDILKGNPKLLEMVTSEALCRPCTTGLNAGLSPLYWLCGNPEGRDILKGTPQLLEGVTSEVLCRPRTTGPNAGTSPLTQLRGNSEGQEILSTLFKSNPTLATEIALFAINVSPHFFSHFYLPASTGHSVSPNETLQAPPPQSVFFATWPTLENNAGKKAARKRLAEKDASKSKQPPLKVSKTTHMGILAWMSSQSNRTDRTAFNPHLQADAFGNNEIAHPNKATITHTRTTPTVDLARMISLAQTPYIPIASRCRRAIVENDDTAAMHHLVWMIQHGKTQVLEGDYGYLGLKNGASADEVAATYRRIANSKITRPSTDWARLGQPNETFEIGCEFS